MMVLGAFAFGMTIAFAFAAGYTCLVLGQVLSWLSPEGTPVKGKNDPMVPVVWTNSYKGGRIFFTSLGAPDDFKLPQFRRLLSNSVLWALDKPVPAEAGHARAAVK